MQANPASFRPRPNPVPTQGGTWPDEVFIAVESVKGTHGWAVVKALDGQPECAASGAAASGEGAVASAVAAAIALAERMNARHLLVVTAHDDVDSLVRHPEVAELGLSVLRVDYAGMHTLGSTAVRRARFGAESAEVPASDGQRLPRKLVAAVDGSYGRRLRFGGWAFVAEGGQHVTGSGRVSGSLEAELLAVDLLLRMTRACDHLTVLMDCREAITILTGDGQPPSKLVTLCQQIADLLHGRDVTFTWVKGHAGHPLNEAANRLAIAERRHREWGTSSDVHAEIRRNILQEELGLAA